MKFTFLIAMTMMGILCCQPVLSQSQALKIGDQLPDINLSEVINYKKSSLKLSDFKGKLLIIDFWATWCSPCVSMLPKTDSLQNIFKDRVQFLPVTYQDKRTAETFLKKLQKFKHIKIPSIVNDKVLNSLFPHSSIPYYVWIDSAGKIVATTEATEITGENIKNALDAKYSTLKETIGTKAKTLDFAKPVFISGVPYIEEDTNSISLEPINPNDVLVQSVATKYMANVGPGTYNNSTHFLAVNQSILNIYQFFYGITSKPNTIAYFNKSRYKIEVKDSTLFAKIVNFSQGNTYEGWLKNNGYCYELIWKGVKNWNDKVSLLKEDLDRYFAKPLRISAGLENRLLPSDVLVITDSLKLHTTGGKSLEYHDAFSYSQHNLPISALVNQLNYFWQDSERIIYNETRFAGNVDIILNCKMSDRKAVNQELSKYGLVFMEAQRPIDVLVIKER